MTMTTRTFKYFMGIDVGKFTLVIHEARTQTTHEIKNTKQAISAFFKRQQSAMSMTLVICETTGGYEMALLDVCTAHGIAAHRANTFRVKSFIRSLGIHGKTDTIDAHALTRYGAERHQCLPLWTPPTVHEKRLKKLMQRRNDLAQMATQEKNRLQAPDEDPMVKQSIQALLRTLETQIDAIDQAMNNIIDNTPALLHRAQLMTDIVGVGSRTAHALLAAMPELGTLTRRQAASLAGLAPHPRDSGTLSTRRIIRGGRREVRAALFMAAMSARRYNTELRAFYWRLVENGKRPIVAITAIMRKLITIINARIRDSLLGIQGLAEQS